MFFTNKQHPLPKFPEGIRQTFKALSFRFSEQELQEIPAALSDTSNDLLERASTNSLIQVPLVTKILEAALFLLEHYKGADQKSQALIAGAIRYFLGEDDSVAEGAFATGLHDDARVINHVLEELGVEGKFIEFSSHY